MLPSIQIESLSDIAQTKVPFTFGHVFAPGDLAPTDGLKAGMVALQVDVKATHADGSVRHAVCSGILPSLTARDTVALQLAKAPRATGAQVFTGASALFTATIAGVGYTAALDPMTPHSAAWLAGPVINERHYVAPLAAGGVLHPHLVARFAVRDYGVGMQRVDMTIENNWAHEPGPQNFTYDAKLVLTGKVVYSKTGMTHYHHARWRKVFWLNAAPQINVKMDTPYLIATKAVPNYDQSVLPSAARLADYGNVAVEPMQVGLSNSYMPMTGGNDGIGVLPGWSAALVLTMDSRARNAALSTADGAGSYSMHFRDKKTDRPVSLVNYPYMTQYGNYGDTWNPTTNKMEAFPGCGGDCATPLTHDISHQPSLAYLPYLLTGDYFYLEEMQFWAMFDVFASNPGYREQAKGLVTSEQLRGQAWALRTLAQAAALTPDADPLKADLVGFINNNLDWYNKTYANNPAANKLGVLTNGYAVAYNNGTSTAAWMDDFFTSAIGHAADLGFDAAKPLLTWKAKFPVGRMTAPGLCWILGAPYGLTIRDSDQSPVYDTLLQSYKRDFPDAMQMPCGGAEMAAKIGAKVGDMGGISDGYLGYPSNMQPALAWAVDAGAPDAKKAWDLFMSRTVKPNYTLGQQFNIVPRAYTAAVLPPLPDSPAPVVPAAPILTAQIVDAPAAAGTWSKIGTEDATITVPADTIVRYGAGSAWVYAKVSGTFKISNVYFGKDPASGIAKTVQAFTTSSAAKPGKVTTSSNTKLKSLKGLIVRVIDPAKFIDIKTFTGVDASTKGVIVVSDVALVPGTTYAVIVSGGGKVLDVMYPIIVK